MSNWNQYGRSAVRLLKAQRFAKVNSAMEAVAFIERQPWTDRQDILEALRTKAAVSDVDSADYGDALSGAPISDDFVAAQRQVTIFDRLGGREVPFHVRTLTGGQGATGYWLGGGKAIPLSAADLSGEIMLPKSVGALVVCTREVLEDPSAKAEERLRIDVVNAAAEALDTALIDPQNSGDPYTPASITSGITPLNSAGATLANIDADLKLMLQELVAAGSTLIGAKWIMSSRSAVYLSLLRGTGGNLAFPDIGATGGKIAGLDVITSGNVPAGGSPEDGSITLVDTNDFVFADAGAKLSLSNQTTVEMSDAAAGNTQEPTAASSYPVSLFTSECSAIKAVRRVNWRMRRDTVSVLVAVTY